jgi:hypothetical protein
MDIIIRRKLTIMPDTTAEPPPPVPQAFWKNSDALSAGLLETFIGRDPPGPFSMKL